VTVFAGPELEDNRLTPDDPGTRRRGYRGGLIAAAEVWYQPRPDVMAAAHGVVATTSDYSVRAAFGWRVFDRFFIGPEAQMFGGHSYQQYRLGVHATAFKTGAFEWSAGGGWVKDSDDRTGAYGRLGVILRQ
jgi:cellulose biosynthesis protein BcsS